MNLNPFTEDYLKKEVNFYGLTEYDSDGIEIETKEIIGRCDEFLNKAFSAGGFSAPIMTIDGHVWMSLTAMELQSHYLPIRRARGKVGTGGLGMGYFTLRAAAKSSVKKIDVYEKDERVIEFFKKNFSDRKGFEKINFIVGDVHKNLRNKCYDYFFMDIYPDMTMDENILEERASILESNEIELYQWWGEEKIILQALCEKYINAMALESDEAELFRMWIESGKDSLYDARSDSRMIRDAMTEMGRR